MNYYIGADLGTSSLKLLLVNTTGKIEKTVSFDYPVSFPYPSWSEQEPHHWWSAFKNGVKELTKDFPKEKIKGIGFGGQMHGLVCLDENDNVIRPAILWNDGRTQKETDYLNEIVGKKALSQMTANIAFAGFTAPKLLWMKANEPDNFNKINKIMLPKDYLNYLLTGVHCTDYSDASGLLLLDVKNKSWSEQMLEICSVTKAQMPRLFESFQIVGTILPQIAEEIGLCTDTIVVAGAGDNAAAAIGTGTVADGKCNISLGTSGTIFISSDKFSVDSSNALHSFCHADGGYHLMGCILSAASCNKWLYEDIFKTDDYDKEQAPITDDDLGNNHVYFLPYLMGERSPINDTDARGTFTGIRLDTKRENITLAVLEGVAFAIRDNFEIAKEQGIQISYSTLCGGGAKSKLWQKIFANVLNIPIMLPQTEQGPGYGGAMLAMVGAKEFESVEDCVDSFIKIKETIYPQKEIAEKYQLQYAKFKKLYPSMKNLFKEIK